MSFSERFGPALAAAALFVSLPMALGSLPIFALGYWDKAEPLIVWYHLSAGLASMAVAVNAWGRPRAVTTRLLHPYVLLPGALGLWSVATAPFADLPLLSVMGAPQSGFGALWFFDLASLTACAMLAAESDRLRSWLGKTALLIAVAVAALKAWDWHRLSHGQPHWLIYVAAYYGWLALPLPLLVTGQAWLLTAAAAAVALAWASHSAAAIGLLSLELGIVWIGTGGPDALRRAARSRLGQGAAVAMAGALPFAVIDGLPALWRVPSLLDRHLIWSLILTEIGSEPAKLLTGHGWGRIQDGFHAWLNVSGQRLWNPDWIFLSSDYFHSHNWALETVDAVGLPGAALFFGLFLALPLCARPERRPWALGLAVATLAFSGLWFQLCLSVPLYALAAASLPHIPQPPTPLPAPAMPRLVTGVAVALCVGQIAAAGMLLDNGIRIGRLRADLAASPPIIHDVPRDFRGSDLEAAEAIRDALAEFARRAKSEPNAPIAAAIRPLLAFLDDRIPRSPTVLLATTGLTAMAQIHVTGDLSFMSSPETEAEQIAQWRRWLERLLVLAPNRGDQAIPYFTMAISQGRWDDIRQITQTMLARNGHDPVGLYYGGIVTLINGDRAQGMRMIRQSFEAGLDRFMPIDPSLKAQVGQ